MEGNSHLSMQLQQAGYDMDLINQVMKLKEIEKLVSDGKVSQEVYDKLINDVLKEKSERVESPDQEGNPRSKSKNMMTKLRSVINVGSRRKKKPKKVQSQRPKLRQTETKEKTSRYQELELEEVPEPELIPIQRISVERRTLLEDDLMRLGQDKHGNAKWRKVKVILYDDSLEYFIKTKKGEIRNKKVIMLTDDFFVNSEINKQQLSKIYSKENEVEISKDDEVFGQPHLFLLSDLDEHYYFAAEDEVKKEFWVSMLVQTIRDITDNSAKPKFADLKSNGGDDLSKSKRYVFKYETLKKNYYQQKIRKTMRIGKIEDFKEENFLKEEAKWKRQGTQLARQSIAGDFKRQEMERAREALEQQEILKKQLADKERALEQITKKFEENEQEWQRKYNDLLAEKREEARIRNEEREKERQELEKQIEAMQRKQALTFRATSMTNLSVDQQQMMQEYEIQLQQYKAKLSALESALNVDVSSLDWDGTLEDAEKKMQALVEDLMSADDEVRREAQAKFDQWDHIVRNHADFKNREVKKWESWENENAEKNRNALNEMRTKYVPKEFLTGISQKDLLEKTGIPKKTARRVMQNRIFKFFYMDKERIAKIHIADLLNNYASQGLDIRELRAVYACLPTDFQNDPDGKKKEFRDNLRNRLAELTKKEAAGTLTANEKMHNAYRDKEIKAVRKIAGGKPKGPRVKKNKNFQNKALALQAMLAGRGADGPPPLPGANKPKAGPPSSKPNAPKAKLDPKAPEWQTYLKMKKNGLPDGAIMNRMQKDGKDPSIWHELQAANDKSSRTLDPGPAVPASARDRGGSVGSFIDIPTLGPPLSPRPPAASPLDAIKQRGQAMSEKLRREDKSALKNRGDSTKKPKKRKSKKEDKQRGSKAGKKKTLRKRTMRNKSNVKNTGDTNQLLDKAQLDYAVDDAKKAAKPANLNLEYGKNAKKTQKNIKSVVDEGIRELIDIILEEGEHDAAEGGQKTMKFGELSDRYESISDMLVGLLLKAKRQKLVKYRGDMLFKGIHDEIKITVK